MLAAVPMETIGREHALSETLPGKTVSEPREDVRPPWHPEHAASPELARRLIERRFPALAPARVEPFGFGWDNTAFLVNSVYVFRFPRRQLGADCLRSEIRVLPRIASRLPLPIPAPEFVGEPCDEFRWPFAGYRRIDGQTACRARLDGCDRRRIAEPLARFLAALHAIPLGEHEAAPDLIDRMNIESRLPAVRGRLQKLRQRALLTNLRPFEAVIDQGLRLAPAAADSTRFVLVHGDLYSRHLLLNVARELCGVIDWGDVHYGSPAVDLAIAHSFLPTRSHDAFRRAYGSIDQAAWDLARFRALDHSAAIALYGCEAGDTDLLSEGLGSLARLGA